MKEQIQANSSLLGKSGAVNDPSRFAGRIYPAKSARLELIDLLKEQMNAGYQPNDRASITRPVLERVVADLEHAILLLDALQDARDELWAIEFARRQTLTPKPTRKVRWGFRSKAQAPLFMVWEEFWQDGDVVHANVLFSTRDWIGA